MKFSTSDCRADKHLSTWGGGTKRGHELEVENGMQLWNGTRAHLLIRMALVNTDKGSGELSIASGDLWVTFAIL